MSLVPTILFSQSRYVVGEPGSGSYSDIDPAQAKVMAKGIIVCAQSNSYKEPAAIGTQLVKVESLVMIKFVFSI
jgi:hypothetical protein